MYVGQCHGRWCSCPLLMNMMAWFILLVINRYISFAPCTCLYLLREGGDAGKIFRYMIVEGFSKILMFYGTFSQLLHVSPNYIPRRVTKRSIQQRIWIYLNCSFSIPRLALFLTVIFGIWRNEYVPMLYKNVYCICTMYITYHVCLIHS